MWHFAVGLYLVLFDGGKLQIAATYGFVAGGCILLLGGIIGNWVDKNGRMKGRRLVSGQPNERFSDPICCLSRLYNN